MYRLMIVDDDPLLCNAMCVKIQLIKMESGLDFSVSAVAHCVSEAWRLFEKQPADILITDIQMPYQSGLELIEQVGRSYPDTQLVVLSGYSDYDYMRGALHGGAADYLLKPIKLSQLREVLVKCAQNVDRQRSSEETLGLRRERAFLLELEHALNGLLTGTLKDAPVLEKLSGPVFRAALFSMESPESFSRLFEAFSHTREEGGLPFAVHPVADVWQNPVLVLSGTQAASEAITRYLEALCLFFREQGTTCSCALSLPFGDLRQYARAHKQARHTLSWQLLEPFTVKEASAARSTSAKAAELHSACCRRMHTAFQSRNFDRLDALVLEYFTAQFFSYPGAGPEDIKTLYTYYLTQVQETAADFNAELEDPSPFSAFTSLEELRRYCKTLLFFLREQSEKSPCKNRHITDTAIRYIEENYNREISMNEAAGAVSMSYSYFSKFFKEQTRQSFSEYLTGVRMREAKKLLTEDPSIKIKDVAALVGYESVYSFSRAFKQFYSHPPKQLP